MRPESNTELRSVFLVIKKGYYLYGIINTIFESNCRCKTIIPYHNNLIAMDYSISNQQESLAELVVLNDIQNNFTSYEAILSIKRWKFIIRIPGIAQRIIKEADETIQKSFLCYVDNEEILLKEGFFYLASNN